MALRESRVGSSGRGSGSGGLRGRGRGGSRGGRGGSTFRGRGGPRGGRGKPIFDSARLAKQMEEEADEEPESESLSEEVDSQSQVETSEDDDVEPARSVRSYTALMQSLTAESAPQTKRRKLEHNLPSNSAELTEEKLEDAAQTDTAQALEDADHADEEEEGPETAIDGLLGDDDDDDQPGDTSDPFEVHIANPNYAFLVRRLEFVQQNQWITKKLLLPEVGKVLAGIPGKVDVDFTSEPPSIPGPAGLKLKQKLARLMAGQNPSFDPLEKYIAPFMFSYQDLLYCERSLANSESLRRLACLHAVNHIFKTRDRVIKNNARLAREDGNAELELRDQGFTRPKVLMVLPTRESCVRIVSMLNSLCEPDQQENRKRFDDAYVEKDEKSFVGKAEDFRELFGGNDDDMFRLGIKFTRKTIKYFSQFYNSDIILGSPLGLRMALEGKENSKGDYDFLSSIEIVIFDQAEALLMQNWEHVEYIFEHLNLQPKEAHGCDFSRVRSWYLDNKARNFRQTIALSAFNTPELNTLFFNQSKNWAGKIKISANYHGAIQELELKVKQTFSRLDCPSFGSDPDARFAYFTKAIIPSLTRRSKESAGTIIFIPSYLDFVRVRNYFSTSSNTGSLSFGSISEYTSVRDVAKARTHFYNGRHSVLLYTERAHHFRRYQLRGVKRVIMYGLPDNPLFYREIVGGYLGRSFHESRLKPGEGSVRATFSKWDLLKLERIVGTERVGRMITEKGDTFDFL